MWKSGNFLAYCRRMPSRNKNLTPSCLVARQTSQTTRSRTFHRSSFLGLPESDKAPATAKANISKAPPQPRAIVKQLLKEIHNLAQNDAHSMPLVWNIDTYEGTINVDHVTHLLTQIRRYIAQDILRATGSHRTEISMLLDRILALYARCRIPQGAEGSSKHQSLVEACDAVYQLMNEYKLELQPGHIQSLMLVAAREGDFDRAARFFWNTIDPEMAGYRPLNLDVRHPIGLYVTARAAQYHGLPVVEHVMDAVQRMIMVSPTDQEQYILAAGTAIGQAGEYEAFLEFLKSSRNAEQMGQTLIAAVMHACLVGGRFDLALAVFEEHVELPLSTAGEWQWGGGGDRLHPLCRDLAMRALTHDAGRAHAFLRQAIEDNTTISAQAIEAVARAYEYDGNALDAVAMFFDLLRDPLLKTKLVDGSLLRIQDIASNPEGSQNSLFLLGRALGSITRNCNKNSQFGMGLLCIKILQSAIDPLNPSDRDIPIEETLLPTISNLACIELLEAITVALCGLGCPNEAIRLYEASYPRMIDPSVGSDALYEFVVNECDKHKPNSLYETWLSAYRHIHLVIAMEKLNPAVLATALNVCRACKQPLAGIVLLQWLSPNVTTIDNAIEVPAIFLDSILTDSLLASGMECFIAAEKPDVALSLFGTCLERHPGSQSWVLSANSALLSLVSESRHDDAFALLKNIARSTRNQDTFMIVAKGFVEIEEWTKVSDLYRLALSGGCLSEYLGIMAIQATSSSVNEGKLRAIRNIVDEISRLLGVKRGKWLESKYWSLKRRITLGTLKALMFWDDPRTSHLDELELAFDLMEKRLSEGVLPNNDALRCIVSAAGLYSDEFIPPNKTGLPSVPRDRESWLNTINKVVELSKQTTLIDHPIFLTDVIHAYCNLGDTSTCVNFVEECLNEGRSLHPKALKEVLDLPVQTENPVLSDLRMLLGVDT